ncbi:MAG: SurA N-terminal domain-containing protein [Pseudomonadota bacterium]
MLGFFRRITHSKVGVVVTFLILGLIAIAFATSDVTNLGHGGSGGMTANTAADIGDGEVGEAELVARAKSALAQIQQEQPTADMAGLIAANGVERLLEQLIDARAFAEFARTQGMVVSKRAIDGQIASIPAFRGADGKFSQSAYDAVLSQQRVTNQQVRDDIARETLVQQLTAPANGGARVSNQLALPYASLLLERRRGTVGFIPASALGTGTPPTDAELSAFYQRNLARYTVPERRVIRYAAVSPATVAAQAAPTDADLAAAFRADPARFAASEKRSAQVVIVLDQTTAAAIVAKAKAGTPLDAAARAAGLEARTLTALAKAGLAAQTAGPVADALFAAPANGVVGPIRAGGGFTIAKLTGVQSVAARTFEQARVELITEVTQRKTTEAITALNDALDKAASDGATFDEMIAERKLSAQKTPALLQNGVDPFDLTARPIASLGPILQAGFAAEQGDAPQIVPIGQDGSFALVALDSVVPSAPRPLAAIKADIAKAFVADRAFGQARAVAAQVVAKANAGTPLGTALAATGLKVPAVKPVDSPRAALAANPRGAEPALALLFAMAPKRGKLLEAPGRAGWLVVYLDTIVAGDARSAPQTVAAARNDLSQVAGREYVQQFALAVRNAVGVRKNPAAIRAARDQLAGKTPDTAN